MWTGLEWADWAGNINFAAIWVALQYWRLRYQNLLALRKKHVVNYQSSCSSQKAIRLYKVESVIVLLDTKATWQKPYSGWCSLTSSHWLCSDNALLSSCCTYEGFILSVRRFIYPVLFIECSRRAEQIVGSANNSRGCYNPNGHRFQKWFICCCAYSLF